MKTQIKAGENSQFDLMQLARLTLTFESGLYWRLYFNNLFATFQLDTFSVY
jgi:hypothetical protein